MIESRLVVALARLDPDSPVPLYQQLREELEQHIAAGRFLNGRLPSSRDLAAELGISRNTVNLAYQELVVDGYVSTRPRSGLVVNEEMQDRLRRQQPVKGRHAETASKPRWARLVTTPGPRDPFDNLRTPPDWSRYPYPFLSSQIDPAEFPQRAWGQAVRRAMEAPHLIESVQDSRGRDDDLLIEQLRSEVLPARGIDAAPEEILITNGTQHGLYLVGKTLVQAGTRVAIENPGWTDAKVILESAGAEIVPIDVDDGGLTITSALRHVRIIVVTPSHHMPTGVTLSIARRGALVDIACESNSVVIEDDYDSELRYQGRPTPALKAVDTADRVIYLGSFSKHLAPGLRLGYVVAAPELIDHLRRWRRIMLRHPSGLIQRAMALFIESGDYHRWLRRHRATLKRKWERIVAATSEHLPWRIDVPTGGVGLWIVGPDSFDSRDLRSRAAGEGVLFEQGQPMFMGNVRPTNTFRLGYSAIREDRIEDGVAIIARLARELIGD